MPRGSRLGSICRVRYCTITARTRWKPSPAPARPPAGRRTAVRLQDRIAIVTGGASGLGRAIALGFAAEGARLVLVDRNYDGAEAVAAEIAALSQQALAVRADVARVADAEAAVARALERFGRID